MKKTIEIYFLIIAFTAGIYFTGCTKEVPKELLSDNNKTPITQGEMPDDSIHRNLKNPEQQTTGGHDETIGDDKAIQYEKDADEADAKYMKSKSDPDKQEAIKKQLIAANYLMFEANLSPKKKYRPALKRYNRILELDPQNVEARENKKQIEDIYEQMGVPVPQG